MDMIKTICFYDTFGLIIIIVMDLSQKKRKVARVSRPASLAAHAALLPARGIALLPARGIALHHRRLPVPGRLLTPLCSLFLAGGGDTGEGWSGINRRSFTWEQHSI